jgi:uncharacterized repeat protein (TIGR03803 family)
MNSNRFWSAAGKVLAVVTAMLIVALMLVPAAGAAGKYKTLHRFKGGKDGSEPYGGLILDAAGNLYGTTFYGGTYGLGTVFMLTKRDNGGWRESVLHSFGTVDGDGGFPAGSLIFDLAGNLYGTTYEGGAYGWGSVFKLSANRDGRWSESVLYSFHYDGKDGIDPLANLIFDPAGRLYGTTQYGGAFGDGTVFQLYPNGNGTWTESVLHSFNGEDGQEPHSSLILDSAGNLYGTTHWGGTYGLGTVFQLVPNGDGIWMENVLYSFDSGTAGYGPYAGLIMDSAGNLYGGTLLSATIYRLTPSGNGGWSLDVLHVFNGKDGVDPRASLTFDEAGSLYGTAFYGGTYGYGVVFKLRPAMKGGWKETVLHSYRNKPGAYPLSNVIFDANGNLYGTSKGDETTTFGSVFEITP